MLYVVGIGAGKRDMMTARAVEVIKKCQVIAGYGVYIDLITDLVIGKELIITPMRGEGERCKLAVEAALSGKDTAVISSGDAGIYGMAALVYETAAVYEAKGHHIDIEVVSGVTAASSAGAVLGAPLTCDFAVISLSDLLTTWQTIESRLRHSAQADFVISIYNPSSIKRADYLERACNIIMEYRNPNVMCGYVRNIGRDEESWGVMSLKEMALFEADMFTTVIIGNSMTKVVKGKLVTPRGYKEIG